MSRENKSMFLIKTIKYLLREGYELKKKDILFYQSNKELYEKKGKEKKD